MKDNSDSILGSVERIVRVLGSASALLGVVQSRASVNCMSWVPQTKPLAGLITQMIDMS